MAPAFPAARPTTDARRTDVATTPKRTPRSLAAVVLAAGKGKRLRSDVPKVLHPVCGRPILWHTLQVVRAAKPARIVVVVGHGADDVREAVRSWGIEPAPDLRRAGRAAGDRSRRPARGGRRGQDRGRPRRERRLRPDHGGGPPEAPRLAPAERGRGHPRLDDPGSAGRLRPRRSRRPPRRRRARGARRAARDPADPRGRDELDRLPARPAVRDPATPRSGEPAARVLPEPGDLDPPRQGRARRRRRLRHGGRPRREHTRRARGARGADPAPDERVPHGGRASA